MLVKDPFVIAPATFELIQKLQKLEDFSDFVLVGGTSLALQIGHRNSIDIDLFTQNNFVVNDVVELLESQFHDIQILNMDKNALSSVINGVKTDLIRHNYPLVNPAKKEENIRYAGLEDIAAFKLNAIINSGKRLKDYVDIYFLLEHYSLASLVDFYTVKYTKRNAMMAIKAVGYFEDIDSAIDLPVLKNALTIDTIKLRIQEALKEPNKVFSLSADEKNSSDKSRRT